MGSPEGLLPLTEAIIYVCEAEKSNAVVNALDASRKDAKESKDDDVPKYLRDNSFASREMKSESGKYLYPHNYGGWVEQQYLPESLKGKVYYHPSDRGFEHEVQEIRKRKRGEKTDH